MKKHVYCIYSISSFDDTANDVLREIWSTEKLAKARLTPFKKQYKGFKFYIEIAKLNEKRLI